MYIISKLLHFSVILLMIACNGGNEAVDDFLGVDDNGGNGLGNSAISFSPSLLNFGDIGLSTNLTKVVSITNISDKNIFLTNVLGENSFFSITGGNCLLGSGELPVGSTCNVNIQFTALTGGEHQGVFTFNYGTNAGDTELTSTLSLEGSAGVNPPTNIVLTTVSATTAQISWTDNSSNETSFEVSRCSGISCATSFVQDFNDFTPSNATSYIFTGLTEGNYYRFRVRAITGSTQSSWLEGTVMVTFGGITSITDNGTGTSDLTSLDCRQVNEGTYASLSWNNIPDATAYFIYDTSSGSNILLDTITAPASSTILTGLNINTSYDLLVRVATSTGFNSQNSISTNITTTDYLPCIVLGKSNFQSSATPNGLQNPSDVMIYGGKLFAVDRVNNRILIWNTVPSSNTQLPDIVLGQSDFTTTYINNTPSSINSVSAQSLYYPYTVWAGNVGGTDKLIVSDSSNHRVLIWNSIPTTNHQAADVVVGQGNMTLRLTDGGDRTRGLQDPRDAWSDGTKLYVADWSNHRVLIWNNVPTSNFETPDVYLGQANSTDQGSSCATGRFNAPSGVWSDGTKLLVSSYNCHRVAIWDAVPTSGNPSPNTMLGQTSLSASANGNTAVQLRRPYRVRVFGSKIYASDTDNHRIKVWNSFPTSGVHGVASDYVIGFSNTASTNGAAQNRLQSPMGITISGTSVIVADYNNHRLMGYNSIPLADASNADWQFGQYAFNREVINVESSINANNYDYPDGMAYDGNQFFVADTDRHRVLVYNGIPDAWNKNADFVIGQGNFSIDTANRNQAQLRNPRGICIAGGKLWVPDYGNHRVMVFDLPITANSPNATAVLGQTSWTASTSNTGLDRVNNPIACHYDGTNFFVVDRRYDRVLIWNSLPAMTSVTDNPSADVRIGTDTGNQTSQNQFRDPYGIYSDGTKLFVTDANNHRVMVWSTIPVTNDQNADFHIGGNTDWTSRNGLVTSVGLNYPTAVTADSSGRVYVLDTSNGRVMVFDNPNSTNPVASELYGKSSFTDTAEPGDTSLSLSRGTRGILKINNRIFVGDPIHSRILATPISP